jgi:hypothetical protein
LPRCNQGGAYFRIKPHLVVDGFALLGKSPFLLVFRLREESSNHPVMQVERFVRQCRRGFDHQSNQRAMTPFRLILLELIDSSLGRFAGKLQELVLM